MVAPIFPLTLTAAEVRKKGKSLLGPLDLSLASEGVTIVLGPNGAGKTTLLRLLHGMERLAKGTRRWAVPDAEAQAAQALVFQTPIVMRRSVLENVSYPLRLRGVPRSEAKDRAQASLIRVGLGHAASRRASVLSGGERQKLALARALVTDPQVLILDEPCASLDGRATKEIEALLADIHAKGTRIIMSTHDLGQARRLASDVVFLHKGQLVEACPAATFFETPRTQAARQFLNGDILE